MLLFAMLMAAAEIPAVMTAETNAQPPAKTCPSTTSHYAIDPTKPLAPEKLAELPPGRTYMAVYRRVDGCEYPMTMVEYRTQGRRR
jgi:predicted transcriptional regulator